MNEQTRRQILDLLADITRAAETACYLAQDVHEEYFEAHNADEEEGRSSIIYDFDRHRVKMGVVLASAEEVNAAIKAINTLIVCEEMEAKRKAS